MVWSCPSLAGIPIEPGSFADCRPQSVKTPCYSLPTSRRFVLTAAPLHKAPTHSFLPDWGEIVQPWPRAQWPLLECIQLLLASTCGLRDLILPDEIYSLRDRWGGNRRAGGQVFAVKKLLDIEAMAFRRISVCRKRGIMQRLKPTACD